MQGLGWAAWLWAGWTEVGWTGLCRAVLHRLAGCGLGCTGWNGVELQGLCCTLHKPWLGCTVQRQGCVAARLRDQEQGLRGCWTDWAAWLLSGLHTAQGCTGLCLAARCRGRAAGGGC
ncbi:hypothetical protein Acr_27g0003310 [Actinidia rufa]|uniref:Secreted protein n=1 Tax=Actinidia rufa TaxID=165716 RepID=A0A7J0H680_9ERIC|nr:hypothetical protein Acr_27g0003310 [Actinidia rufa]